MTTSSTDQIVKEKVIKAPRSRVWQALTNAREFGEWFRVDLEGEFVAGQWIQGKITYPAYEGLPFLALVDRIEPESLFSYRWHPYDIDPSVDNSDEPMTLVVFELEDVPEGTRLRVTESGFDQVPVERRSQAFRENSEGWAEQVENIATYVEGRS